MAANPISTIADFLNAVGGGQTKQADAPLSEAGSIGGATSHPVKSVDDRLQKAKEGERSSENSKDVKEDQGAPSVENAPEAKAGSDLMSLARAFARTSGTQKKAEGGAVMQGGSAADDQLQIGTNKQPTGDDPKSETNSAKSGKEDPGSSHPARTDNDQLDGHKYSLDANAPLEQLAKLTKEAGDNLCAAIFHVSKNGGAQKTAEHAQQVGGSVVQQQPQTKQAEIDPYLAHQAGWEMASLIAGKFDKRAADSMVTNTMYSIVKQASDDADLYIWYAKNFLQGQQKQAEGEMPMDPAAGGGAPPGGDPMAGGGGGGGEDAMMAALGGGAPPGGDPMGGGAPPGGDPMGGGGGGGMDPETMALAQLLQQANISPEELEAALAEQGGGGGGDPMGGMGGDPMAGGGGEPPMPGGEKPANDRGGRAAQQSTKHAGEMHKYITELVGRSRARRAA